MKNKIQKLLILFSVFLIFSCNESRVVEPPVEQKRPTFSKIIEPLDSSFAYSISAPIKMQFSELMDISTFPNNFILWEDSAKTISVPGAFSTTGTEVVFTPDNNLLEAHQYYTELKSRVKDVNGNGIEKDTALVSKSEFFTSGKYSEKFSPEFYVISGSEDLMVKTSVKEQLLEADTVLNLNSFGRQLEMAFTLDGSKIIMTDYNTSNSGIYFIDPDTYKITKKLTSNGDKGDIKKSAEIVMATNFAYVVNQSSKVLSTVNLSTEEITAALELPGTPKGMAISPDQTKIYIGSTSNNQIWVIDVATNSVEKTLTITGLTKSVRLAISSDNKYLIIREFRGNNLFFVETQSGSIAKTIDLGYEGKSGNNNDLAVAGDFVYVSNNEGFLTKINTSNQTIDAQIIYSNFQGIDIHPNSEILVATIREPMAKLAIILPENLKIIRLINIGEISPWDVAIRPNL